MKYKIFEQSLVYILLIIFNIIFEYLDEPFNLEIREHHEEYLYSQDKLHRRFEQNHRIYLQG